MKIGLRTFWIARLLGLVAVAAGLVGLVAFLPLQTWLLDAAGTFRSYGLLGIGLFALVFVVATVALVPASPFALVAGLVYGGPGLALAWLCMMAAGAASFWLARSYLAPPIRDLISRRRVLQAAVRVVDEEGWRMILLIRISGLAPFGLQNYGFAISHVSFAGFLVATAIGVLPSIVVSAGIGIFGSAAGHGEWADDLRWGGLGLASSRAWPWSPSRSARSARSSRLNASVPVALATAFA